jgi:hypothetical protein
LRRRAHGEKLFVSDLAVKGTSDFAEFPKKDKQKNQLGRHFELSCEYKISPIMANRILLFALAFVFNGMLRAQTIASADQLVLGQVYRFELVDGSNRTGQLDSLDAEFIYITNLVSGPDKFYRKAVSRAKLQVLGKGGMFASPHYSRYVFGPSAIPQRKKELYWNNLWLEANTFQLGITDNLSAGMGFGLFSSLAGFPLLLPNFKYGVSLTEKHHVAVGAIGLVTFEDFDYNNSGALPFAVYTYGGAESQITAGLGWLYDGGLFSYGINAWSDYPTVYVAGSHRVARNWLIGGEFYQLMYNEYDTWSGGTVIPYTESSTIGMFYGRNIRPTSSWDFAVCTVVNASGDWIPFPLFGYTQRF